MLGLLVQIGHEGYTASLREPIDFQKKNFRMSFIRNNDKNRFVLHVEKLLKLSPGLSSDQGIYSAYPCRIHFMIGEGWVRKLLVHNILDIEIILSGSLLPIHAIKPKPYSVPVTVIIQFVDIRF